MRDLYGAFTLPDTQTDTDTDKMGIEPKGNTFHTVLGNRSLLVLWCIHTGLVRNWDWDWNRDQYYAEPFTLHRDLEEWVVWF